MEDEVGGDEHGDGESCGDGDGDNEGEAMDGVNGSEWIETGLYWGWPSGLLLLLEGEKQRGISEKLAMGSQTMKVARWKRAREKRGMKKEKRKSGQQNEQGKKGANKAS